MKEILANCLAAILVFLAPIWGFVLTLFLLILLDTAVGVLKAVKLKQKITSYKLSAVVTKSLVYFLTVLTFYTLDVYVLNEIVTSWIEISYLSSKLFVLLIAAIELKSIRENADILFGIDIKKSLSDLWKILYKGKKNFKKLKE